MKATLGLHLFGALGLHPVGELADALAGASARDEDLQVGVQHAGALFQAVHVEVLVQGQVIAFRDDERIHGGEHYPIASMMMGQKAALFTFVGPFLASTLCGTVIAAVIITALYKSKAVRLIEEYID